MAERSAIEWTDSTFNPWIGCTKIGPGCDHCYAEARMDTRLHVVQWGPNGERKRTSAKYWRDPIKWNAEADAFKAKHGRRQRVFCASLADVFDNEVDREWRDDLSTLIQSTPNLDWLLLTKRIGNAGTMLGEMFLDGPPDNLWLGATVTDQTEADRDIPKLLRVPARRRFLSIEPMLGAITLPWFCACGCGKPYGEAVREAMDSPAAMNCDQAEAVVPSTLGIDWVICGGESGPNARPMNPEWARSLRDQCEAAGVPYLFKQWGEFAPTGHPEQDRPHLVDAFGIRPIERKSWAAPMLLANQWIAYRVGKKAGRMLDGRTHDGFPVVAQP